jgi:FO synthase
VGIHNRKSGSGGNDGVPFDPHELGRQPLADLMAAARDLRDQGHGELVTYSRKVFIPLTRLCRDVCHYCTFATMPGKLAQPYLSAEEAVDLALQGQALSCKEALFTLGEKPELRHEAARAALNGMGFATTLEYVAHVAQRVIQETGLLPHINAGCMSPQEIAMLRPVSASMGLMLENVSPRLCEKGQVHYGSPDKDPALRLQTIEDCGRAGVPFTTGILIGIGETRREIIESLLAIRDVHERHGHIQEVIVQNFVPKADTKMRSVAPPGEEDLLWTIAMARILLGPGMSVQAPPNLNPGRLARLVDAGINDWGGVSPLTPDHVNPESPWPHLEQLAEATAASGKLLVERLTVYPEYLRSQSRWLDERVRPHVLRLSDAQGLGREDDWLSGQSEVVPAAWRRQQRGPAVSRRIAGLLAAAEQGEILGIDDIERLFMARGSDFDAVCATADRVRAAQCGDTVSYVVNRNINYTNICSFRCAFCAFAKGRKRTVSSDAPYVKGPEEVAALAAEAWERGATEVCLQGGIHPSFTGETYLEILRAVRAAVPEIHIHAFSPLEVTHGARSLGLALEDYLRKLAEAGLRTLPGTAAEILCDEVRDIICPDKISTAEWLEVLETAHGLGLRTTATIMFGHVDRYRHWGIHLDRVRELQRRTGGITEFVPLPFVAEEAPIYRRGEARRGPTFREAVLMHAVARLTLGRDIQNIQTSWVKMGLEGAAFCLGAGCNDLGGTLMNESITRAAGARHGQEMKPVILEQTIRECGRVPGQRNTLYQSVDARSLPGSTRPIRGYG